MSLLAIRLFCNECTRSVIMEREFFLDILLKWRDSNPYGNEQLASCYLNFLGDIYETREME
jgi:hypothetical protein